MLALLHAERGALEDAGQMLGATNAFRARSGYKWRAHYLRRRLEPLQASLPLAALANGGTLSLDEAAAAVLHSRAARGRPDRGWDALTPSEARVVELVAAGLSNAAIAERLHVSLATIKTHLVHVYDKLGLSSRAELAATATARRLNGSAAIDSA